MSEVEALRAENARLKALLQTRDQGLFGGATPMFEHTFGFVWPALKNQKRLVRNPHTGKAMLITHPEVKAAVAAIRDELERKLKNYELPLFGTNEVGRSLEWNPEAETIRVRWWNLGPTDKKAGRKRDLVNLAALLDDAVGRLRAGRKVVGTGLIYRDDAQIAEAYESRRAP